MPAKSKEPHRFRVGHPATVRDVRFAKVVNTGIIVRVTRDCVVFEGPSNEPGRLGRWAFDRKGTRWVQAKVDHYELEAAPKEQKGDTR